MAAPAFAPLASATVATQVQQQLEEAIYSGQLKPGQRLLEVELAEAMQVSRASFREALRLLQNKGLVTSIPRRGVYVTALTEKDVREIYTIRLLLEGYAIRHAAEHADQETIDRLQELVGAMQGAADVKDHQRIVELDLELHRVICSTTGNRTLLELWGNLVSPIRALNLTKYRLFDDTPLIAEGHQKLVDAIRARDPEMAEERLKTHIVDTAEQVLDSLAHEPQPAV